MESKDKRPGACDRCNEDPGTSIIQDISYGGRVVVVIHWPLGRLNAKCRIQFCQEAHDSITRVYNA